MAVFLRPRSRLRCLSAMAMFAWLMLVLAPSGAWSRIAPATHASHDATPTAAAGCCDDHANRPDAPSTHNCSCPLPCTAMMPVAQVGLAALPAVPAGYAPPRPIQAPLSDFAPPLRPPLT